MNAARRPDFFIVGAPKCGTTALYTYLGRHPEVYVPDRKELRFFGTDLEVRDRVPLTMDAYLGRFAEAGKARRVGSAYVWYLYSTRAAE
jgi:Sulfotransferase family